MRDGASDEEGEGGREKAFSSSSSLRQMPAGSGNKSADQTFGEEVFVGHGPTPDERESE